MYTALNFLGSRAEGFTKRNVMFDWSLGILFPLLNFFGEEDDWKPLSMSIVLKRVKKIQQTFKGVFSF